MLPSHTVDLVSHKVKVQSNGGMRNVSQRHFNIFKLGPVEVGDLDGGIDDAGDAAGLEEVPVGGHAGSAQEERGGDLSNASYVSLGNHPRGHESPWERAVTSGAHEDASGHTIIIRGQTREQWSPSFTRESKTAASFLQNTGNCQNLTRYSATAATTSSALGEGKGKN